MAPIRRSDTAAAMEKTPKRQTKTVTKTEPYNVNSCRDCRRKKVRCYHIASPSSSASKPSKSALSSRTTRQSASKGLLGKRKRVEFQDDGAGAQGDGAAWMTEYEGADSEVEVEKKKEATYYVSEPVDIRSPRRVLSKKEDEELQGTIVVRERGTEENYQVALERVRMKKRVEAKKKDTSAPEVVLEVENTVVTDTVGTSAQASQTGRGRGDRGRGRGRGRGGWRGGRTASIGRPPKKRPKLGARRNSVDPAYSREVPSAMETPTTEILEQVSGYSQEDVDMDAVPNRVTSEHPHPSPSQPTLNLTASPALDISAAGPPSATSSSFSPSLLDKEVNGRYKNPPTPGRLPMSDKARGKQPAVESPGDNSEDWLSEVEVPGETISIPQISAPEPEPEIPINHQTETEPTPKLLPEVMVANKPRPRWVPSPTPPLPSHPPRLRNRVSYGSPLSSNTPLQPFLASTPAIGKRLRKGKSPPIPHSQPARRDQPPTAPAAVPQAQVPEARKESRLTLDIVMPVILEPVGLPEVEEEAVEEVVTPPSSVSKRRRMSKPKPLELAPRTPEFAVTTGKRTSRNSTKKRNPPPLSPSFADVFEEVVDASLGSRTPVRGIGRGRGKARSRGGVSIRGSRGGVSATFRGTGLRARERGRDGLRSTSTPRTPARAGSVTITPPPGVGVNDVSETPTTTVHNQKEAAEANGHDNKMEENLPSPQPQQEQPPLEPDESDDDDAASALPYAPTPPMHSTAPSVASDGPRRRGVGKPVSSLRQSTNTTPPIKPTFSHATTAPLTPDPRLRPPYNHQQHPPSTRTNPPSNPPSSSKPFGAPHSQIRPTNTPNSFFSLPSHLTYPPTIPQSKLAAILRWKDHTKVSSRFSGPSTYTTFSLHPPVGDEVEFADPPIDVGYWCQTGERDNWRHEGGNDDAIEEREMRMAERQARWAGDANNESDVAESEFGDTSKDHKSPEL